MFDKKMFEMEIGGRTLKVETGKVARQADGAVLITYGETVLLATVVGAKEAKSGTDFFPLTVDVVEKMYASGKIPGGFFKREARPSTVATLTARLIDRPLRPLFPEGYNKAVHVVITVLSYDGKNTPDYLGLIGASAALTISGLPFGGPVAGVTVGYIDEKFILNPTPEELKVSELELTVAGTLDAVTMVEAGANELSEEKMLDAIMFGHEKIKEIVEFQKEIEKIAGKEKLSFEKPEVLSEVKEFITEEIVEKLKAAVTVHGKEARETGVNDLEKECIVMLEEKYGEDEDKFNAIINDFKTYYHDLMKKMVRESILYKKHRVDGRRIEEVRPLDVETDILTVPHGSALFTRGETQALVTATLGTSRDEQIIDGLDEEVKKKFFLHYNFPPYSVGEAGFMRGPGRRELGHGSLAERALSYVMPSEEEFPYTVRVVSEITESNGSSSQASICGGSLALMDAGVPIKAQVAGIAMGLIKEGEDFVVLTDIMGLEDHLGDMDFKVAGTEKGITALQMDIKITGISKEIMEQALSQALDARKHILNTMNAVIAKPNEDFAPNVPRVQTLKIEKDKIASLIGPGGKTIKGIIEETGSKIDIEDDGTVKVFSEDKEILEKTIKIIEARTKSVKEGEIYEGKITKIMDFGAFVEILPGKEGLVHISEIAKERVKKVTDILKEGEMIKVKVVKIDPKNGKIGLSRKALLTDEKKEEK
ncbi:MAG: polyribonucleotide nucleotidyltransferase [Fusobacteriia bacterium 4572_132]|nr:MAG: polyribonucleotide nucleotidyltransferase [Fusobacteriia bacterium 4572_132]